MLCATSTFAFPSAGHLALCGQYTLAEVQPPIDILHPCKLYIEAYKQPTVV